MGTLFIVISMLFSSAREVITGNGLQHTSTFAIIFVNIGLLIAFYQFRTLRNWPTARALLGKHKSALLKINGITFVQWSSFIFSLNFLVPAHAVVLSVGAIPITSLVSKWLATKQPPRRLEFSVAIGITAVFVVSLFRSISHNNDVAHSPSEMVTGSAVAILSGVATSINTHKIKALMENNVSSDLIMANRFYALFLLAVGALAVHGFNDLPAQIASKPALFGGLAGCTLISVATLQVGMERVDTIKLGFLFTLEPVMTMFVQVFDKRLPWSWEMAIINLIVTALVILGMLQRNNSLHEES